MAMSGISDEAIKERAYHIWVREGCPHGRDFEHWVQAQVELEAEQPRGNGAAIRAKAAKPAAPRRTAAAKAAAAPAAAKAAATPKVAASKAAKAAPEKPARKPAAPRAKKKP
jgi:hypothetical protein